MSSHRTLSRSAIGSVAFLMVSAACLAAYLLHRERTRLLKSSLSQEGGCSYGYPNDEAIDAFYAQAAAEARHGERALRIQTTSIGNEAEWFANSPRDTETRQARIRRVRAARHHSSSQDQEQDG